MFQQIPRNCSYQNEDNKMQLLTVLNCIQLCVIILLAYLPNVGLYNFHAVCVNPPINLWLPERIFIKLGVYVSHLSPSEWHTSQISPNSLCVTKLPL
jgi:hypothetical protein